MNVYVKNAKYFGNFKFTVKFNVGEKIVDINKVRKIDKRYDTFAIFQPLKDENFVKNLKSDGFTLSYKNVDIAPELLYQASI